VAKYTIQAGLEFDSVSPAELRGELDSWDTRRERQMMQDVRSIKPRRIPPMSGVVAAAAVLIGGDTGQPQTGPTQGNLWMLRSMNVNGLASGATPDLLNMQIFGAGSGVSWWQFGGGPSGVPFFAKWGMGELWLEPGEYLGFSNFGALTAAAGTTITVRGTVIQIPAEKVGRLFAR
jgi:hypothetical protein